MKSLSLGVCAIVLLVCARPTKAQLFTIERNPGSPSTVIVENTVDPNNATRARIIIEATSTSGSTIINLRATNPANSIDYLIIRIATPQLVILQITGANQDAYFASGAWH